MKKLRLSGQELGSVFIKNLIILLLVAVLPLGVSLWYNYVQTLRLVEEQTREADAELLTKVESSMETICSQAEQVAEQLANDPNILALTFRPNSRNSDRLQEAAEMLNRLTAPNPYITSVTIYSSAGDWYLDQDAHIYVGRGYPDIGWKEWFDKYKSGPYWTDVRPITAAVGRVGKGATILTNLPYVSQSKVGAVILNLDLNAIYKDTVHLDTRNDTRIFVQNGFGNILLHADPSLIGVNGSAIVSVPEDGARGAVEVGSGASEQLVSYLRAERHGFTFVCMSSSVRFRSAYRTVMRNTVVAAGIISLFGLSLALRASMLLYTPWKKLLLKVPNATHGANGVRKNEYEILDQAYSSLHNENIALNAELLRLKPLIEQRFFQDVLWGRLDPGKNIQQRLALLDGGFTASHYAIIAVYIPPQQQAGKPGELQLLQSSVLIREYVQASFPVRCICLEVESNILAVILNFIDEQIDSIPQQERDAALNVRIASGIRVVLHEKTGCVAITGRGRSCASIQQVHASYAEAMEVLRFRIFQSSGAHSGEMVEYEEAFSDYTGYMQSICEMLRNADLTRLDRTVDALSAAVGQNAPLRDQLHIYQVFSHMLSLICEAVLSSVKDSDSPFANRSLYVELSGLYTLDEANAYLKRVCRKAAEEIARSNHSNAERKVRSIIDYIEQHFEEDLSLVDVSEVVGLTPAYVSRIFKECTGANFVEYLNEQRVHQAKLLLKNTELSIKEIGFRSGFNSLQTFMRVFKRSTGVAPGQYRDSCG